MFPNNQNDDNKKPDHPLNRGSNRPPNNNNNGGNNNNNNQNPNGLPPIDWRRWAMPALLLLLLGWMLFSMQDLMSVSSASINVPYSILYDQIQADNVRSIEIVDQSAQGVFRNTISFADPTTGRQLTGTRFQTTLLPGSNDALYEALSNSNAVIQASEPDPNLLFFFLMNIVPLLLIVGFFIWMARRTQRQMGGAFSFGRTQAREYNVERPQVTFDDVAGQDSSKQELEEVVDFLREPDKYIALGARIPRGVLLIGPPGTGKTLLARAVAGEASVAFFSIAASEFVEMFVGVGASRVRDLFKRARDNAPSIVFIDEIDAVGRQRGAGLGGGNDEREQTLNQMLAEMDGFDQTDSVIVMAATNRPDVLDPALLRPGRFDRQVTVGLPDRNGREAILKIHTRGKPLAEDVKLTDVAKSTIGFSGADIANLCNEAALTAARRNGRKIKMRDFHDAFDRIVLGTERPPLSDKQKRKLVAYHEAGHALASAFTPGAAPVLKVTIIPRGGAGGVTVFTPEDDGMLASRRQLEARLVSALGGRAAEEVVLGEVSTGAVGDLRQVYSIARAMVTQFGMSDEIGQVNFGDDDRQPFLGYSISQGRSYSEETAAIVDQAVRRIVDKAYEDALKVMREHRTELDALANALLENEMIGQDEMLELFGLPPDFYSQFENVFKTAKPVDNEKVASNGNGNGHKKESAPAEAQQPADNNEADDLPDVPPDADPFSDIPLDESDSQ